MPAIDDLDLIRGVLAEPGPSAALTERGRARLDVLAATESARGRLPRLAGAGTPGSPATESARGRRPRLAGNPAGAPWSPATGWARGRKGTAAAAAGLATLAVAVAATFLGGSGHAARQHGPRIGAGRVLTAQQVLLTAAEHAAIAPATTGKYWHVDERAADLLPAGTLAHRYDIFAVNRSDQWTAKAAGKRSWYIWQTLPARLDTPADVAAWRAAGSPAKWTYGGVAKRLTFTLSAQAPGASWQVSDGTVGYIEGDEAYLTAAQFAALPDTAAGLRAVLVRYAMKTWSARHPGGGGATVDQLVWSEAVALLTDPVTPRVRAAAFKVMAGLPGVTSLGRMRDPLGRMGYGLGLGPSTATSVGQQFALIDPAAGLLLGTTLVGRPPACLRWPSATCHVGAGADTSAGSPGGFTYYGRQNFSATTPKFWDLVLTATWTNARPPLPPAAARVRG